MPKTVKSPRADSLPKLRDLIILGIDSGLSDARCLGRLAQQRGLFVTQAGTPYDHSSEYRYFSSLLFLGFNSANGIGDPIEWSPAAFALATAGREAAFTNTLTEHEKAVIRDQIFRSDVMRADFLASFCPNDFIPATRDEFFSSGHALYILGTRSAPNGPSHYPGSATGRVVEFKLDIPGEASKTKPVMEFLYTYRLWCLDVSLIEEINIKEATRWSIPKERSHVLYPTTSRALPDMAKFLQCLYSFADDPTRPISVPLAVLFYKLCLDMRLTVSQFKKLLIDAKSQYPSAIHFERAPGILIQGDMDDRTRDHSRRFGNHRYYIILDGTVRSSVVLFPRG